MITEFITIWDAHKSEIEQKIRDADEYGISYSTLLKYFVEMIHDHSDEYEKPDPERITVINHGDYQGTLVFVIGSDGYQPYTYWATKVSYGSCSGCDTIEAIRGYSYNPVTNKQVQDYMTLTLHMLQSLKEI